VPCCSRFTIPTKNPLSVQHSLRNIAVLPGRFYFTIFHHRFYPPIAHLTNQTKATTLTQPPLRLHSHINHSYNHSTHHTITRWNAIIPVPPHSQQPIHTYHTAAYAAAGTLTIRRGGKISDWPLAVARRQQRKIHSSITTHTHSHTHSFIKHARRGVLDGMST